VDIFTIIIIAIGLAMDCFAVSIAQGLAVQTTEQPKPILMAVLFGLFQGGMPLIGYFAGNLFADFFRIYAPWIALALLAFIGGKMIWESLHEKDEKAAGWQIKRLIVLAVATSIDALATGVIFIPVPERVWLGVGIIGLVSFLFSIGGYHIGKYVGARFKINVELIGGIILILIGLKIWAEGFLCL
jgi:putative Mn2+ efflux pump MntP